MKKILYTLIPIKKLLFVLMMLCAVMNVQAQTIQVGLQQILKKFRKYDYGTFWTVR